MTVYRPKEPPIRFERRRGLEIVIVVAISAAAALGVVVFWPSPAPAAAATGPYLFVALDELGDVRYSRTATACRIVDGAARVEFEGGRAEVRAPILLCIPKTDRDRAQVGP